MKKNYNPTIHGDGNLIYYVPFEFVMKKEQNNFTIQEMFVITKISINFG